MTDAARRLRRRRRLRRDPRLPRRADQLVHPALPRAVLGSDGRRTAFDTLYTVLETVCRRDRAAAAADHRGGLARPDRRRSVHLADWPDADDLPADDALVAAMDQVREVCSAGSALRKAARPAQPAAAGVADRRRRRPGRARPFEAIVADELNVKEVRLLAADSPRPRRTASRSGSPSTPARPARGSARTCSRRSRASKSGDWSVADDGTVTAGGLALSRGSTPSRPSPARPTATPRPACCRAAASSCSTPPSRPSSRPRASPATWSARSSRPAGRRPRRHRPDRADHRRLGETVAGRGPDPRGPDRRARPSRRRTPSRPPPRAPR